MRDLSRLSISARAASEFFLDGFEFAAAFLGSASLTQFFFRLRARRVEKSWTSDWSLVCSVLTRSVTLGVLYCSRLSYVMLDMPPPPSFDVTSIIFCAGAAGRSSSIWVVIQ